MLPPPGLLQPTYEKLLTEVPKYKMITPSVLADRLRVSPKTRDGGAWQPAETATAGAPGNRSRSSRQGREKQLQSAGNAGSRWSDMWLPQQG